MSKPSTKRLEITKKIRQEWGTVRHFCRKHNINNRTFGVVMGGNGKSKPITDLLIEHGYLADANELNRVED